MLMLLGTSCQAPYVPPSPNHSVRPYGEFRKDSMIVFLLLPMYSNERENKNPSGGRKLTTSKKKKKSEINRKNFFLKSHRFRLNSRIWNTLYEREALVIRINSRRIVNLFFMNYYLIFAKT